MTKTNRAVEHYWNPGTPTSMSWMSWMWRNPNDLTKQDVLAMGVVESGWLRMSEE